MISKDTVAKILDYARIEEVVGDFVNLKRAGANLKGNCPFHDEKTPSFTVSPAKNIYKCFGCGAAGDPLKFVMEHEHMSYPEALRYLAAKYRIEIEETETFSNEQKEQQSVKESLYIAMKYAAGFYQEQLLTTEEGKSVGLTYFRHRGFTEKTIADFQLGYAPDSFDHFNKAAQKAGYQLDILEKAGLVRMREGKSAYDFFRARVMFPIHNLSGKVVAFGGRIMTKDPKQAKYINTQETDIYTKGQLVYGIYQAKAEIRKKDTCFLVEGYTDVLSLYQAGISNVVASSGTALTKEQVKLIRRFTSNIVLIYDGDKAGINAALRGVDIMLEEAMDVKVVILPDGEDPDSFVRNRGTDTTLAFIQDNKKDFIFFKADILLKNAGNDPTQRAAAIRNIVESISLIQDPIRKAYYTRECSKLAELPEEMLIKEVNKQTISQYRKSHQMTEASAVVAQELPELTTLPAEQPAEPKTTDHPLHIQERDLLRVLFQHGHRVMEDEVLAADFILDHVGGVPLTHLVYQRTFDIFIHAFDGGEEITKLQDEKYYEDHEIRTFLIDLKISPYQLSPNWETQHNITVKTNEDVWEADVRSTVNRYIYHRVLDQLKAIDEALKVLNPDDEEQLNELLTRKITLQKAKIELARQPGLVIFK